MDGSISRRTLLSSVALLAVPGAPLVHASSTITTIAGTGLAGYTGDGDPAGSARLYQPRDTAVGPDGRVYIVDTFNNRVRRISAAGVIATVAGVGAGGFSGDGGPATQAGLHWPHDICVSGSGVIYVADANNNRVRRIDLQGTITTVAGTGVPGFCGDGGWARLAQLMYPKGIALFGSRLYLADSKNHRVRAVDLATGRIHTVAGTGVAGFAGDGGPATRAALDTPQRLALDPRGNLYVADTLNHRIRRIDPSGTITTVAGNGMPDFSGDGGPAVRASLNHPRGVAVRGNVSLFVGDSSNNRVRRVDLATGVIRTVAGDGRRLYQGDGGRARVASLYNPRGLSVDASGAVIVADTANNAIRRISP